MMPTNTLKIFFAAFVAIFLLSACSSEEDVVASSPPPASLESAVDLAADKLGMQNLDSITYSGTAWNIRNSFRQTPEASPPWPLRDTMTNYKRTINLDQPASLATADTFAQDLFFAPAVASVYIQNVPENQTNWGQQLELWLTPWGFLKGAELYGADERAELIDGSDYTVVTWMSPPTQTSPSGMQYTVTGYINSENLVDRVETWVEDAFMGDMHVSALYSDYTDFDGVLVPATMEQQRGEGGIYGVNVAAASANPANLTELMTPPEQTGGGGFPGGGGQAPTDLTQEIAEGVYLVSGGYVALVVEFADHLVVFESGQSEARGEQVIAEIKDISDKPIRYIVNSHPHSDHTAGLVPFVREGATIITHESNVDFLEMALNTPRTLLGEETLKPMFIGVGDVGVREDSSMRFEFHHIPNGHTDGMLVGYLPEQGILFQADFTLPLPGVDPNPFVVELANYIDESGLEFDTYLAVHAAAAPQTKADLMATIGK